MRDSITDIPGILVGHAQNRAAGTGCTVILCESGFSAGVDVRGGSPGTRETDCLSPSCVIAAPNAFYLCGGSAFGLAGATGVQKYLEERGIGFDAGIARVPIVSGAVIFDLNVGASDVRPDEAMGIAACRNASRDVAQGNVGAGTGATAGWAGGSARRMKAGLGTASRKTGDLLVGAIVVVNCFGDVVDPSTGEMLAGTLNEAGDGFAGSHALLTAQPMGLDSYSTHSTIGVIATNAELDKGMAQRVATMAHDGLARAIVPVHTSGEGDVIFSVCTGEVPAGVSVVGALAAEAMTAAVLSAVTHAESAYGYPCHRELLLRRAKTAK